MIYDSILNLSRQELIPAKLIHLIQDFMTRAIHLPPGRHELDGARVFANIAEYETEPAGLFELHRRYADLQVVLTGRERHGIAPEETLAIRQPYSEQEDCMLLQGEAGERILLDSSTFVLYPPGEPHAPGLTDEAPEKVKKVVFKIDGSILR